MNEQEAIQSAQAGDHEGFRALYDLHHKMVLNRCRQFTRDPEEARDLTQDVFLLLHQRIKQFRNQSTFTTWLYRIATNKAISYTRSKAIRLPSASEFSESEHVEPSRSPYQHTQLEVREALNRVPEKHHFYLDLATQGYKAVEVGRMCGCRASTAKSRMKKAAQAFRVAMA